MDANQMKGTFSPLEMKQKALELADLKKLNYQFKHPPLLVAGVAMMYYGFRESTKDVDLIIHPEDHKELALSLKDQATLLEGDAHSAYREKPEFVDLYGDHGIWIYQFEIWDNIFRFGYDDLKEDAIPEGEILIISLEKLQVLCTVRGLKSQRYMDDAVMIAQRFMDERYEEYKHEQNSYWKKILE